MFNLLISAKAGHWDRSPATFSLERIFEHTSERLATRYGDLEYPVLEELLACPALFAYEHREGLNARVGRISRVRKRANQDDIRIDFEMDENLPAISPDALKEMAWELDMTDWEFNRTHWAVKDVDLQSELVSCGVFDQAQRAHSRLDQKPDQPDLVSWPTIFRVPEDPIEEDLVSVMRPFKPDFHAVQTALETACTGLGLRCRDVNMEWQESEIIQDVFSLLYRSSVVICDFSEQNPNVFYEAGIAHTLGRVVIPIVQNPEHIPFDLGHHRYLEYETSAEGLQRLIEGVTRRLETLTSRGLNWRLKKIRPAD